MIEETYGVVETGRLMVLLRLKTYEVVEMGRLMGFCSNRGTYNTKVVEIGRLTGLLTQGDLRGC